MATDLFQRQKGPVVSVLKKENLVHGMFSRYGHNTRISRGFGGKQLTFQTIVNRSGY